MNDDMAKALSDAICHKMLWDNWPYYLVLIVITFLGGYAGSFLSGYSRKRGEQMAIKADLDDIKTQIKATTEITEKIRNDIAHEIWRKQQSEALRRQKLEEYLTLVYTAKEDLSREMFNSFFYQNQAIDVHAESKATMLMKLYFTELREEHSAFLLVYSSFKSWLAEGMKEQISQRKQGKEMAVISEEHMSKYSALLDGLNAATLLIEGKASQIAENLISQTTA